MGFWLLLSQMCKAIFTCSHARAHAAEGKTFCPDCGQGVIFRWVLLRCSGCGQRRQAGYLFRQVVPLEPCCISCGDARTDVHHLVEPEFFQLHYALLQLETETAEPSPLYKLSVSLSGFLKDTLGAMSGSGLDPAMPALRCLPH